jgi:hypothetical protein
VVGWEGQTDLYGGEQRKTRRLRDQLESGEEVSGGREQDGRGDEEFC